MSCLRPVPAEVEPRDGGFGGGAPSARGKVVLTGRHESEALSFTRGGMHTIGKASVSFR